jgi:hypothetical protein
MSADGKWKITVQSPLGMQVVTADIRTEGATFSARTEGGPMGGQDIAGEVMGDTLTWSTNITSPIHLKIDFEAKVDGDRMAGQAKLGMFGNAPLTGERV